MRPPPRARRRAAASTMLLLFGYCFYCLCWGVFVILRGNTSRRPDLPPASTMESFAARKEVLVAIDEYMASYTFIEKDQPFLIDALKGWANADGVEYTRPIWYEKTWAAHTSKFLVIDYPLHLGLNNLRWALEAQLFLAQLLKRRLVLPWEVHIHDPVFCYNATACDDVKHAKPPDVRPKLNWEFSHYWVHLEAFFDMPRLEAAGGVYIRQKYLDGLWASLTCRDVYRAAFYSPDSLWLDRLPKGDDLRAGASAGLLASGLLEGLDAHPSREDRDAGSTAPAALSAWATARSTAASATPGIGGVISRWAWGALAESAAIAAEPGGGGAMGAAARWWLGEKSSGQGNSVSGLAAASAADAAGGGVMAAERRAAATALQGFWPYRLVRGPPGRQRCRGGGELESARAAAAWSRRLATATAPPPHWSPARPWKAGPTVGASCAVVKGRDEAQRLCLRLPYWQYPMGDEMTYAFPLEKREWSSDEPRGLFGFLDEFGRVDAKVLHLTSDPMFGGKMPLNFHSVSAAENFARVARAVRYPRAAVSAARDIMVALWANAADRPLVYPAPAALDTRAWRLGTSESGNLSPGTPPPSPRQPGNATVRPFLAVHYRRGDVTWTSTVLQTPESVLAMVRHFSTPGDSRRFYLATEGGSQVTRCDQGGCKGDAAVVAALRPLTEAGAVRWVDVLPFVDTSEFSEREKEAMAFGDWVGMVEQLICACSRFFIGSARSSVTGGVLNLRQDLFGTAHAEPYFLMSNK